MVPLSGPSDSAMKTSIAILRRSTAAMAVGRYFFHGLSASLEHAGTHARTGAYSTGASPFFSATIS